MIRLIDVYKGGRVARGAVEFLYELLSERPSEANISHRDMPSIEHHRQFVIRRPYRSWLIVEAEDELEPSLPVLRMGAVYLTERNEVGVAILRRYQRRGIARRALIAVMRHYAPLPAIPAVRPGQFVAHVNPSNAPSIALFEGLGARHIASTYELP